MISLLFFHPLNASSRNANLYTQYTLAHFFYRQGHLGRIYAYGVQDSGEIPQELIVDISKSTVLKAARILLKKMESFRPTFNSRFYIEKLVDSYLARIIDLKNTSILYSSKPAFLKTFRKAKKENIRTIQKASSAHPLYNYKIVREEEEKFGLPQMSGYSNLKRAKRLAEVYQISNTILVTGNDKMDFLPQNYSSRVDASKLIIYKYIHIVPPVRYQSIELAPSPKFLYVSQAKLIKGTIYLLQAWELFVDKNPGSELYLVGSVDQNSQRLINKYKNLKGLHIAGFTKDPFAIHKNAWAFINCSLSEAGPATIVEAMQHGIPVITTQSSGLAWCIDNGSNGYKYNGEVNQLAQAMSAIVDKKDGLIQVKENAIKTANHFCSKNYTAEMKAIFGI